MNPIEVPSFGFDENVGMRSHGDSAFFSVVVVADTTSGAWRGDAAFGASAANTADGAIMIAANNNSNDTVDCIINLNLISIYLDDRDVIYLSDFILFILSGYLSVQSARIKSMLPGIANRSAIINPFLRN